MNKHEEIISELIQFAKFKTLVTKKMHHWRKVDDWDRVNVSLLTVTKFSLLTDRVNVSLLTVNINC